MSNLLVHRSKDIAHYLFIGSRTPIFIGFGSAIVNLLIALRFDYGFADLKGRFVFSVVLIVLAGVMVLLAFYFQRLAEKKEKTPQSK